MSANGFDQWAAADFDSHTDPVAADQAFAFVGDGVGVGFGEVGFVEVVVTVVITLVTVI